MESRLCLAIKVWRSRCKQGAAFEQAEASPAMDAAFNGFQPVDPSLGRPIAQERRKAKFGAFA